MLIKPLIIGKLPVKYENKHYTTRMFIYHRYKYGSPFKDCSGCDFYVRNYIGPNIYTCARYTVLMNDWRIETLCSLCNKFKHYKLYKII